MKRNYLLLGTAALLALGGWWIGLALRRGHQLITLDVRNVPLAEVLRKIESQTGQKLRAETGVDTRVTLHVKVRPLSYVLDRLAEQAGARWATLYAVFGSARSLAALDSALRHDGKLEPAGWTQIAPKLPPPDREKDHAAGPVLEPDPAAGPAGPGAVKRRMMLVRATPNGPVVFSGGVNGATELWSPEQLILETSLRPALGDDTNVAPTSQAAAETAHKLKAQWTTYYALEKSSLGIGFGMPHPGAGLGPIKHLPNDRFARLTPEQRVQRTRERLREDNQ